MVSMVVGAFGKEITNVPAADVIGSIKNGTWQKEVEKIREVYNVTYDATLAKANDREAATKAAKEAVRPLKNNLFAVLWSGTFKSRGDDQLDVYSGLLCADLDDLPSIKLNLARKQATGDPHVQGKFISPTGTGLKLVFKVAGDASQHRQNFEAVKAHVKKVYGIDVDEACKNVERLCFVSYDPDAFWRDDATPLQPIEPAKEEKQPKPTGWRERAKAKEAAKSKGKGKGKQVSRDVDDDDDKAPISEELLRELLEYIDADDYGQWIEVVGAIKLWGNDVDAPELAFEIADEWSRTSERYKDGDTESQWEKMKRGEGEDVAKVGTIFHLAKDGGWEPKRKEKSGKKHSPGPEEIDDILAGCRFWCNKPPHPLRAVYTLDNRIICTPGNLATITAATKVGKSSVVAAMLASAMGEPGRDYLGFGSANPGEKAILHFDTEQSPDDHWRLIDNALERAGLDSQPHWFYSYCLSGLDFATAWACVLRAVKKARQERSIHSLFLDGIGDLVANVNDPQESNAFVAGLHYLAIQQACPLIGVIHFNPGSEKTRGHLGSQLERKAETNLRLDREADGATVIWSDKQRRAPISKDFGPRFTWDEEAGMHTSVISRAENKRDARVLELREMFLGAFEKGSKRTYSDLIKWVKMEVGKGQSTSKTIIRNGVKMGVLRKNAANAYEINGYEE